MVNYVIYKRGEPVGTFATIDECAKYLGVMVKTAYMYATPSHKLARPQTIIERVAV